MRGAEALLRQAAASGVDTCFANPGTTELSLVTALDATPQIRPVLTLFEGVAAGAADGYARMRERPALTLFHMGPSLGNAVANLHNARRARSPVINLVGDQPSWHLSADPPLATDIEGLARPVSDWVARVESAEVAASRMAEAHAAAMRGPGGVATLIVPADAQWGTARDAIAAPAARADARREAASDAVTRAAQLLRAGGAILLLGGHALRVAGLRAAARIAAVTRGAVLAETFPSRVDTGGGAPPIQRLAYLPAAARVRLGEGACLILAGAPSPVAFFGGEDRVSSPVPEGLPVHVLSRPDEDVVRALERVADELHAPDGVAPWRGVPPEVVGGLDARSIAAAIALTQPEDSIVIDEGVSMAGAYLGVAAAAPRASYLTLTGGATGQGIPCALGAAIACPGRRVILIEGDGSALYTPQGLWSHAREGLPITTLVLANGAYRILQLELARAGSGGRAAARLTDLSSPRVRWQEMAMALGVPAERVDTADALVHALRRSYERPGPTLLELVVP